MANARSGMAVDGDCINKYNDLKTKRTHRFLTFEIKNEQIQVDKVGGPSATYDDFKASLPENDCRFSVFDYEFTTEDHCNKSKIFFILWSPDTSKIKSKMMYATSKDEFRQKLAGVQIELQATDAAELAHSIIHERATR